ncbi:MAG: HAMP domain-containing histidine kinase [candidate division Zixibacteria bacterium]|nr:HAMP domain-containing histidine kinase [candidate division Zixibacteria bacterium]
MAEIAANKTDSTIELEREVIRFTSIFAHDLVSPLVSIKAIYNLIESGRFNDSNKSHKDLLHSSRIAIERAEAIIQDLLKTAQSGTSQFSVNLSDCSLNQLLTDSCRMAHPAASEQKIKIITRLPRNEIIATADKLLFGRIMDNLIFNAIRHTPPNGEIVVSAEVVDNMGKISVSDSGTGLKDINPEELFTVFKQLNYRDRGLHRGVGIGLFFCRMAVEQMGGKITAKNGREKGAIITFSIPAGGCKNET